MCFNYEKEVINVLIRYSIYLARDECGVTINTIIEDLKLPFYEFITQQDSLEIVEETDIQYLIVRIK